MCALCQIGCRLANYARERINTDRWLEPLPPKPLPIACSDWLNDSRSLRLRRNVGTTFAEREPKRVRLIRKISAQSACLGLQRFDGRLWNRNRCAGRTRSSWRSGTQANAERSSGCYSGSVLADSWALGESLLMLSPRGTSPLSLAMLLGNVSILLTRRQPQDHIGNARAEAFMGGDTNTPCQ
jgi:hypothetical protein